MTRSSASSSPRTGSERAASRASPRRPHRLRGVRTGAGAAPQVLLAGKMHKRAEAAPGRAVDELARGVRGGTVVLEHGRLLEDVLTSPWPAGSRQPARAPWCVSVLGAARTPESSRRFSLCATPAAAPVAPCVGTDRWIHRGRQGLPSARTLDACTETGAACGIAPRVSPGGVAQAGGVPARTQGAPRRSASAGRAGTRTRRRTGSRPARACRAQTPYRRREALRAPARRESRRGPKAQGRSSLHCDAPAAGCRRAIRPSDTGDPPTMPAGISYGAGLASCAARNGHRRARWRPQGPLRRREENWRRATCAADGRCSAHHSSDAEPGSTSPRGLGGSREGDREAALGRNHPQLAVTGRSSGCCGTVRR